MPSPLALVGRSRFARVVLLASLGVSRLAAADEATMSPRQIEADLAAHGIGLRLPDGSRGAIDWVFDSRLLVVHADGVRTWVGRSAKSSATCGLPQLLQKAQAERGFLTVVKSEERPIPLIAYATRVEGRNQYLVESCVPKGSAICGAPELRERAAVENAWKLCATLTEVKPKPASPQELVGTYSVTFVDDDPADRAAGRGGTGKRSTASLRLSFAGGRAAATYAVTPEGDKSATSVELHGVKLADDRFSADPIVIKAAWPAWVPHDFDGRFADPGVLLLGGKRFIRAQR